MLSDEPARFTSCLTGCLADPDVPNGQPVRASFHRATWTTTSQLTSISSWRRSTLRSAVHDRSPQRHRPRGDRSRDRG